MAERRGRRFWIRYLLATSALVLLALEAGVRLLVPSSYFAALGNVYRTSPDPEISYTFAPNQHTIAYGVDLDTNSLGFRGPEWAQPKPPGLFRIALIGDSHTFGYAVPFPLSFGEQLARELAGERRVESLNFGVVGYNSSQELAVFRRFALPLQPDLVVIVPCNNDDDPTLRVDSGGYLWNSMSPVPDDSLARLQPKSSWLLRHSRLWLFVRIVLERHHRATEAQRQHGADTARSRLLQRIGKDVEVPRQLVERVRRPLAELIAECKRRGIPVVLAPFAGPAAWRAMLLELGRSEHVPVLELLGLFPDVEGWDDLMREFGVDWTQHLNGAGYRRWADGLARLIREQGWLRR